ncbi:MAG: hypothetical protein D6693_00900 [Planctomycetota bacterium]|nr:MAG: hypothetical protein D6693_00900 [Planctomycetota bacterium]
MTGPIRFVLAMAVCSGLGACRGGGLHPGPAYPENAPRLDPLDIQLRVGSLAITFTNTTARVLPEGRVWLNAWYSAPAGPVGVGETVSIPVSAFRDEHGEAIRGGGFFAAEAPEPIVLAQYATADGLHGVVVVVSDDGP